VVLRGSALVQAAAPPTAGTADPSGTYAAVAPAVQGLHAAKAARAGWQACRRPARRLRYKQPPSVAPPAHTAATQPRTSPASSSCAGKPSLSYQPPRLAKALPKSTARPLVAPRCRECRSAPVMSPGITAKTVCTRPRRRAHARSGRTVSCPQYRGESHAHQRVKPPEVRLLFAAGQAGRRNAEGSRRTTDASGIAPGSGTPFRRFKSSSRFARLAACASHVE
jgi:hypothetical protein